MPPRIRTSRGTRTVRKTNKTITKKVAVLIKKVNNQEAPFVMHIDAETNLDIFTTPTVKLLEVAASLPSTVTGTKTLLKTIKFKGNLKLGTASADTEIARVVVVMDKRKFDNDTAPVWLDVFNSNNVFALRADTLGGEKKHSFQVLSDRTYTLNNDEGNLMNLKIIQFSKSFKSSLHQFNYASYSQNLIYIMFMSTAATSEMDFSYENAVLMSRDN